MSIPKMYEDVREQLIYVLGWTDGRLALVTERLQELHEIMTDVTLEDYRKAREEEENEKS